MSSGWVVSLNMRWDVLFICFREDVVMGDIAVQENKALDIMNREKLLDWLDTFGIGAGLNDKEKEQFLQTAVEFNLNPLKREIYCIAYGSGDKRKLSLITGYEVYLKRAERSGLLDGWSVSHEGSTKDPEDPLRAVVTIHRKDWKEPMVHKVYFFEYNTGRNLWKTKPLTMIKKVAMAQAFRLCFPDELGGMPYTSDEMSEEMEMVGETSVSSETDESTDLPETSFGEITKDKLHSDDGFIDDIPWKEDKKEVKSEERKKTVWLTAQKREEMIGVIEQVTDYTVNNKQWLPTYSELIEYVDKLEITAEKHWVKTGQDPIAFIDEGFKAIMKVVDENKASQEQDLDIF